MAKVVVTGAAGHLGANLVRQLLAAGQDVRVLVRADTRGIDGLDVERVVGDVLDEASLARAFTGAEVVYHLAALISIAGPMHGKVAAVNVQGVNNVVRTCLASGVKRLIHFSSIHAFCQIPKDRVLDENRSPSDTQKAPAYDHSKARGEREVLAGVAQGLDAVIVNPTAVLGPFDFKPSRMGQVMLDLYHRRLPALVEGGFDWVDARDVCQAAIAAEGSGQKGERYLLSGTYLPVAELARVVGEITGKHPPRMTIPQWMARPVAPLALGWSRLTGAEPRYSSDSLAALRTCNPAISHAKATNELGYAPRPLRTTIQDTLDWFALTGRLNG